MLTNWKVRKKCQHGNFNKNSPGTYPINICGHPESAFLDKGQGVSVGLSYFAHFYKNLDRWERISDVPSLVKNSAKNQPLPLPFTLHLKTPTLYVFYQFLSCIFSTQCNLVIIIWHFQPDQNSGKLILRKREKKWPIIEGEGGTFNFFKRRRFIS